MIICHQCGHKFMTSAILPEVECPKCHAKYITKNLNKSGAPTTNRNPQTLIENPYEIPKGKVANPENNEQTLLFENAFKTPPPIPEPQNSVNPLKVGLKFWGIFELDFLEQIKTLRLPNTYQKEIIAKSRQNGRTPPTFYLPKNRVILGRKPTNLQGFEDVDVKLETQDASISRRQCTIEVNAQYNQSQIQISTHEKASNLIEVDGKTIEKNQKKIVYGGEFLRLGNSVFEIIIENSSYTDLNKTLLY